MQLLNGSLIGTSIDCVLSSRLGLLYNGPAEESISAYRARMRRVAGSSRMMMYPKSIKRMGFALLNALPSVASFATLCVELI